MTRNLGTRENEAKNGSIAIRNAEKYAKVSCVINVSISCTSTMARISNTKLEKLEPQYSIFHNVSNICVTLYELISIHMSFFNLKYMMPIWYEFSTATAARKMFFCKFLVTNEVENKYGML